MSVDKAEVDCDELNTERLYEVIGGIVYLMSPAPSFWHQSISGELLTQLNNYLRDKPCIAIASPCDVKLWNDTINDYDTVEPDIFVLCSANQIKQAFEKGYVEGIPDFIIEVMSPSTMKKDDGVKKDLYFRHGIREYWLVYPGDKFIKAYVRQEDGVYAEKEYYLNESINVSIFGNLNICLQRVFGISDDEIKVMFGDND